MRQGSGIRGQGIGTSGLRPGDAQGFTIVELLIAMGITLAISGAIAAITPQAREAFERVPAELEIQQRGRTAIDTLAQAVRAAGRDVPAAQSLGALAQLLPAITLADPGESETAFRSLTAIVPVVDAAQGLTEGSQASSNSPLTLAITACPNLKEVCGFTAGVTAAIVDSTGHVDVFGVASTNAGARRLTPDRALSRAYGAGAVVVEVDRTSYRLDEQADGSQSLVRVTAAGAVQPVADYLSSLSFAFAHQRLEIALTVHPLGDSPAVARTERQFRTSVRLRNVR